MLRRLKVVPHEHAEKSHGRGDIARPGIAIPAGKRTRRGARYPYSPAPFPDVAEIDCEGDGGRREIRAREIRRQAGKRQEFALEADNGRGVGRALRQMVKPAFKEPEPPVRIPPSVRTMLADKIRRI